MANRADDLKVFDLVIDEDIYEFAGRIRQRSGFKKIGSGSFGTAYANNHLIWKIESGGHSNLRQFKLDELTGWSKFIISVRQGIFGKSANVPSVKMLVLLNDGIAALTNRVNVVGQKNEQAFSPQTGAAMARFCDVADQISYAGRFRTGQPAVAWMPFDSRDVKFRQRVQEVSDDREFVDAVVQRYDWGRRAVNTLERNNIRALDALRWYAKYHSKVQSCGLLDLHNGNVGVDNRGNIVYFDPVS